MRKKLFLVTGVALMSVTRFRRITTTEYLMIVILSISIMSELIINLIYKKKNK